MEFVYLGLREGLEVISEACGEIPKAALCPASFVIEALIIFALFNLQSISLGYEKRYLMTLLI